MWHGIRILFVGSWLSVLGLVSHLLVDSCSIAVYWSLLILAWSPKSLGVLTALQILCGIILVFDSWWVCFWCKCGFLLLVLRLLICWSRSRFCHQCFRSVLLSTFHSFPFLSFVTSGLPWRVLTLYKLSDTYSNSLPGVYSWLFFSYRWPILKWRQRFYVLVVALFLP